MYTAGIDEVGRGALAGPVFVAAAVLEDEPALMKGLEEILKRKPGDSKQLTKTQRERAAEWLKARVQWGLGEASAQDVDELGIVMACRVAAGRALISLPIPVSQIHADAGLQHPLPIPTQWFVKGDEKISAILCASILAKVARDRYMEQLATLVPHFGWDTNVGYGTNAHRLALLSNGPSTYHRRSFLRGILESDV